MPTVHLNNPVREARAQRVAVTEDSLVMDLIDGRSITAPLVWYPCLLNGTAGERNNWRLIADGEGIHWPDLDEDLSVDSLVVGRPSGESPQSLKRWTETLSHMVYPPEFEAARNKYRPDRIELLFIAEAPPAHDSRRFFYFVPVEKGDTLFLEMMKVLYPKKAHFDESIEDWKTGYGATWLRPRKVEFLKLFSGDRFYLIDAVDEPMPKNATSKVKEDKIRKSVGQLKDKLDELVKLCNKRCLPVIQIGAPVFNVCAAELTNSNVRILNNYMIDMPARGGMKKFRRKLRELLSSHHIKTSDSCS